MNSLMKRMSAGLLALCVVLSLVFVGIPGDAFASSITYSATSNSGTRDVICTSLDGTSASSYYTSSYTFDALSQQSSNQLLQSLRTLMTSTHKKIASYDDCKNYADQTDCENGNGKVLLLYTSYSATMSQWNGWNREHVWPQSLGGGNTSGGGADLHHIRPSDQGVNSSRGNKKYGDSNNGTAKYGSNPATGCLGGHYNGTYFEPLDNVKGDVARICLYVYVRWGSNWGADSITDVFQSVDVLLEWMELDPVDTWEMGRNEVVENIQGNRNVFIDYPEFAWLIFGKDVPDDYNTPSDNGGSAVNPSTPSCTHQWNAATCTLPKTCSKCGATTGTAPGHTWQNATCQQLKTCTVCSKTEGSLADHVDANKDNACDVCKISMGTSQPPVAGNTFVKVTTAPTDWSGEYLIVCEEKNVAFDGSLTTLDAVRNNISVTIEEDKITLDKDDSDSIFVIASNGSGYSIKSSSGYYVGITGSSNGLKTSTGTAYNHTLSLNSDGSTLIKCGSMILRFNANRDQMRFRYYGSGQQPVTLYKRIEHTHDYTSVVTPPTCTEGGYTTYTCTCGATYTDNEMAVLGHNYTSEETKTPTCTEAGEMTYTCGTCGDSYTEAITAIGHNYTSETTPPTCEADGYTTYTCGNCGDTYTDDVVAALPHTNEYTNNGDGTHKYACSVCGAVETASAEHTYDDAQDTDCNACGAVREVGPEFKEELKFYQTSLSYLEYIGVQLAILPEVVNNYDKVYVEAIQNTPNGVQTEKIEGFLYYDVLYVYDKQVLAWSMTDEITLTIYAEKDGVTYVGETKTTSVEKLAKLGLSYYLGIGDKVTCRVLVDMLNYGAAVQVAWNENTGNLPNREIEAYAELGTTETPKVDGTFGKTGTGELTALQVSLSMQSKVEIQMLFYGDMSAYEARVKIAGVAQDTIPGEEFVALEDYEGYVYLAVAFKAQNLRDEFEIAFYEKASGTQVSPTYTGTIEAYAKTMMGGNQRDVIIAMMRYGDAVKQLPTYS